jgi:tetratricopeptide (TPR) repeat protein
VDEAIVQFQRTLAIDPNNAEACYNLGIAYFQKGQTDEAIVQFQKALALQPGYGEAQAALTRVAWIFATSPNPTLRNGAKAVELAQYTDQLAGGTNPMRAATLAAAYAETGNFPEAVTNAQRAMQWASSQNNPAMVAAFQAQLKNYQAGTPFHASATDH